MERAYPRLLLGCGNFGGIGSAPAFFGQGETLEQAFDLMDAAWEAGITWFDTADAYGGGRSETYVGEWIRTRKPDGLRITTKTFNPMAEGEDRGLAPARVRRQIDTSLQRLGVGRVDLYLAHAPDPDVPMAELAGVFEELVAAGEDRRLRPEQRRRHAAAGGARSRHLHRSPELVLAARSRGRAGGAAALRGARPLVPGHSPLMGGWLTGKYRRDTPAPEGSRMTLRSGPYEYLRDDRVYDALEAFARRGHPATLALGWLLADERVSVVIGPRRPVHLGPALDALASPLTQQERDALSDEFRLVPQS